MLSRIQYLTVCCSYICLSPLLKQTHITEAAPSKAAVYAQCGAFYPLLAIFVSHGDKVPRLQVCIFSAIMCEQRKVAASEEIDGGC